MAGERIRILQRRWCSVRGHSAPHSSVVEGDELRPWANTGNRGFVDEWEQTRVVEALVDEPGATPGPSWKDKPDAPAETSAALYLRETLRSVYADRDRLAQELDELTESVCEAGGGAHTLPEAFRWLELRKRRVAELKESVKRAMDAAVEVAGVNSSDGNLVTLINYIGRMDKLTRDNVLALERELQAERAKAAGVAKEVAMAERWLTLGIEKARIIERTVGGTWDEAFRHLEIEASNARHVLRSLQPAAPKEPPPVNERGLLERTTRKNYGDDCGPWCEKAKTGGAGETTGDPLTARCMNCGKEHVRADKTAMPKDIYQAVAAPDEKPNAKPVEAGHHVERLTREELSQIRGYINHRTSMSWETLTKLWEAAERDLSSSEQANP